MRKSRCESCVFIFAQRKNLVLKSERVKVLALENGSVGEDQ